MIRIQKTIKEYTALIVAVVLFFLFPYAVRLFDPTAGVYDSGVLQNINLAVISFCVFMAISWTVLKNIWPILGEYGKKGFNEDFKGLTKWERQKVFLFVYFGLFLLLAILSRVY